MADANMRIIITALNQTQGAFKQIKDDMAGLKSSAGGYSDATNLAMGTTKAFSFNLASMGKIAAGVTAAIYAMKKAYDFAEEGAEISRLRTATTNYAIALGGDMQEMVAAIRKSSRYTISEYDAMSSAGSAMILGLGTDSEKLSKLVEIAAYRGRITGETAAEAFDDIVRGIGRLSPLILDNIGIFIDADKRYAEYAATTGKSADSLTSFEKRQALVNGIIEEAMPIVEETGGLVDDTKTSYEVLGAWFADQGNKVKEFWGGVADKALTPLADLIQENNALEQAGKDGIITGQEYIEVKTKLAQGTWTEADAMEWLSIKTEAHSRAITQDMLLNMTSAAEYESWTKRKTEAEHTYESQLKKSIKTLQEHQNAIIEENAGILLAIGMTDNLTRALEEYNSVALDNKSTTVEINAAFNDMKDISANIIFDTLTNSLEMTDRQTLDLAKSLGLINEAEYMVTLTTLGLVDDIDEFGISLDDVDTLAGGLNDSLAVLMAGGDTQYIVDVIVRFNGMEIPFDVYSFLGVGVGVGKATQLSKYLGENANGIGLGGLRQFGGSVNSGNPYLVGEAGPELFIPQDNGRIVSNNNLGIGGKNVTVNIKYAPTVSTASESEVQWILKPMILRALKEA